MVATLFILVVSPERFKYTNPQHAPPVRVMEYCVDKCYYVDSYSDAMYWFPSGDDVHFCDCIDTILPLKNLQTEFLEWKGLALFMIYSILEEVCDFMGLCNFNEKKRSKREITGPCPKAPSKINWTQQTKAGKHWEDGKMGSKSNNTMKSMTHW